MSMAQNASLYNIVSENQIATILSHFNSEYIMDTINEKIANKFNSYTNIEPNIVYSYELNFNQMKYLYPGDTGNINEIRLETYREIIDILCKNNNLSFNVNNDDVDIYSCAFYLYDFLVANFFNYATSFFVGFIIKEKNNLYELISNIDDKNIYNKKYFKDTKVAAISSKINTILDVIKGTDISLADILSMIYPNDISSSLYNLISSIGDFYKDYYVTILNDPALAPIMITNIRLELQKYQMSLAEAESKSALYN